MIDVLRKSAALLSRRERRRGLIVFAMMLVMALLEVAGVASVMPFVAVLSRPELVETNPYLAALYTELGFTSRQSFLFALGVAVLVIFVSSLAFKALTTYAILRFSTMRLHTLACRLFAAYLRQPYEFFVGRNTASMAKSILAEVSEVTNGVMVPAMKLVANAIVAVALILLLVVVEPVLSVAVALGLGVTYGLIHYFTRRVVTRIGQGRLEANRLRFVLTNEVLGGVKELRVLGREGGYLDRFRGPSLRYARYHAAGKVIRDLPRYAVEALGMGGMLIALLYLMSREGGLEGALPLIALYALAVYRLLPAFQQIFASASQIRFTRPALDALYADLTLKERTERGQAGAGTAPLPLKGELRLENISYSYPGAERPALDGINLAIQAGSSVAFVGKTGAGKSTLADIVLGLLAPTRGRLLVDGDPIGEGNLRAWQSNLGYVPQSIYLADDTVAANIAFGLPEDAVDPALVERAARIAQIHDFVVDELPNGYRTVVGERGVRLSGGQRQRLAIARALYHDPGVILFDEGTSALDNATEAAVMGALQGLRGEKTIIMIAHRLSTVRDCDRIFLLDGGRLVSQGDYDGLLSGSSHFKRLVSGADA